MRAARRDALQESQFSHQRAEQRFRQGVSSDVHARASRGRGCSQMLSTVRFGYYSRDLRSAPQPIPHYRERRVVKVVVGGEASGHCHLSNTPWPREQRNRKASRKGNIDPRFGSLDHCGTHHDVSHRLEREAHGRYEQLPGAGARGESPMSATARGGGARRPFRECLISRRHLAAERLHRAHGVATAIATHVLICRCRGEFDPSHHPCAGVRAYKTCGVRGKERGVRRSWETGEGSTHGTRIKPVEEGGMEGASEMRRFCEASHVRQMGDRPKGYRECFEWHRRVCRRFPHASSMRCRHR